MRPSELILHAPNVHTGGGRTLLHAVLGQLDRTAPIAVSLDRRVDLPVDLTPLPAAWNVHRVDATLTGRWKAERWLQRTALPGDTLICFGNLPPLCNVAGRVIVFVQNRFLLPTTSLAGLPWRTALRIQAERLWFWRRQATVDRFVVQTESMRRALRRSLSHSAHIEVVPFVSDALATTLNTLRGEPAAPSLRVHPADERGGAFDFCYVASGEPHKNHRRLVEAWCELAAFGSRPSLALTLDRSRFGPLCAWIEAEARRHRLRITNLGSRTEAGIADVYAQSKALVYPSLFESFGLPLLEAKAAGLKLITAERDYVRDVVVPAETFDPESPRSICAAVLRSLGEGRQGHGVPLPAVGARAFLQVCLPGNRSSGHNAAAGSPGEAA